MRSVNPRLPTARTAPESAAGASGSVAASNGDGNLLRRPGQERQLTARHGRRDTRLGRHRAEAKGERSPRDVVKRDRAGAAGRIGVERADCDRRWVGDQLDSARRRGVDVPDGAAGATRTPLGGGDKRASQPNRVEIRADLGEERRRPGDQRGGRTRAADRAVAGRPTLGEPRLGGRKPNPGSRELRLCLSAERKSLGRERRDRTPLLVRPVGRGPDGDGDRHRRGKRRANLARRRLPRDPGSAPRSARRPRATRQGPTRRRRPPALPLLRARGRSPASSAPVAEERRHRRRCCTRWCRRTATGGSRRRPPEPVGDAAR